MKYKGSNRMLPQNTKYQVIIPSNSYTFDKRAYVEKYLEIYLDQEDFESIIEEINKLVTKAFITKGKMDEVSISKFVVIVATISLIFTGASICLLYYSTVEDKNKSISINSEDCYNISLVLMATVIILLLVSVIRTYSTEIVKFQSLDDIIKGNMNKYLGLINNYFQGFLEWNYVSKDKYIQINIISPDLLRNFVHDNQKNEKKSPETKAQYNINTRIEEENEDFSIKDSDEEDEIDASKLDYKHIRSQSTPILSKLDSKKKKRKKGDRL